MSTLDQAGLVCLTFWCGLVIAVGYPAAWREPKGWKRRFAVLECTVILLVLEAITAVYLWGVNS